MEVPSPPSIHLKAPHLPLIQLNSFEIMKMLQAAYTSDNPHITMEAFLVDHSIPVEMLKDFISWILWQTTSKRHHPLEMLSTILKETRQSLAFMQPETVKKQFIFYATMLPHIWVREKRELNMHFEHAPVFYKTPNSKVPFVWLTPNDFGMLKVIHSYKPIPFSVSLLRKEHRGAMLPLDLAFFDKENIVAVRLEMTVDMDSKEGFALTRVHKNEHALDFMLLLTRGTRYLRCILVQPSSGNFLLYPVCVHSLSD